MLDVADTHDPRITKGARDRFADLEQKWKTSKGKMNDLLNKDITDYNQQFKEKGIPAVILNDK